MIRFSTFTSVLAINPKDNSTIPISGIVGYGSVVNWPALSQFYDTPVGQETLYSLVLTVYRHPTTRALVVVIFITNCGCQFGVFHTVMRRGH